MVQSRTEIPQAELDEENLAWAFGVWQDVTSYQVDDIQKAKSIMASWHRDRIDLLRKEARLHGKDTELWLELKHEEETLEGYIIDLKDALIGTMHTNKMTGGA